MPHEVLICHAAGDAPIAMAIQSALSEAAISSRLRSVVERGEPAVWDLARDWSLILVYSVRAAGSPSLGLPIAEAVRQQRPVLVYQAEPLELLDVLKPALAGAIRVEAWDDPTGRPVARLLDALAQARAGKSGDASERKSSRPAGKRPRSGRRFGLVQLKSEADTAVAGPRLSSWKGWSASIALHAAVLLLLGLTVFRVPAPQVTGFDTVLGSDDLPGDSLGRSSPEDLGLTLGAEDLTIREGPTLTTSPLSELKLDPELTRRLAPEAVKGSGRGQGGGPSSDGFGVPRFAPGTETIRGVQVRTGDPQFTLLWNTQADLDLHVIEPGGAHIFWIHKGEPTRLGGMLDVDNVKGHGPENVFWTFGQGPPGDYKWYVEYYGGFGGYDVPTRWTVRIKQNGEERIVEGTFRKIGEKSKPATLRVPSVPTRNPATSAASTTDVGPSGAGAAPD